MATSAQQRSRRYVCPQQRPLCSLAASSTLSHRVCRAALRRAPRATAVVLTRIQEIDSTVGIMRDNINKVSERGARLDSLQDKTDNLAVSAQGFRRGANRVRKQMWWKDMKMRMCLIVGIIILLVVIIVPSGELQCTEIPSSSANMPSHGDQK